MANQRVRDWQVLLLFAAGTFLLYGPVLRNGFLTDDYASLYRISVLRSIALKGFLRPLIDISFGFNYLLGGLHPLGYYLFNFVVHIGSCYGVYKVAGQLSFFEEERRQWAALLAGVLFLIYPFHNEPVVWLAGRLSSMACLCGLWAVYFFLRSPERWGVPVILFFVGLLAYESIIMLPVIVVVLGWRRGEGIRKLVRMALPWVFTGIAYMVIRLWVAGVFLSGYSGGVLVQQEGGGYGVRLCKALGRSFIPPGWLRPSDMIRVFVAVCLVAAVVHMVVWLRRRQLLSWLDEYTRVFLVWLGSLMPAVAFGVSTHTSEGDRLLYFPSAWFCILVSAWVVFFVRWWWLRWGIVAIAAVGGALLIRDNDRHWVKASGVVQEVLDSIRLSRAGKVVMVNLPDEASGAFIFRNNFDRALVIHGVDSNKVVVSNSFMLADEQHMWEDGYNSGIRPVERDGGWFIYPRTLLRKVGKGVELEVLNEETRERHFVGADGCQVYYWDGFELQTLTLQ